MPTYFSAFLSESGQNHLDFGDASKVEQSPSHQPGLQTNKTEIFNFTLSWRPPCVIQIIIPIEDNWDFEKVPTMPIYIVFFFNLLFEVHKCNRFVEK